jgi:hypothetical protein
MVQTMRAFLEFCYIARRDIHDTHSLIALDDALQRFHHHREIFRTSGIRTNGFNLPRQHSLIHYVKLIRAFGAPNGLCSSITESMHIKAVKEPWRRSSRFEALGQMLLTNQRLAKLAAARIDFSDRGMLRGTLLSAVQEQILRMHFSFHRRLLRLINIIGTHEADFDTDLSPDHPYHDLDSNDTSNVNNDSNNQGRNDDEDNEDEDGAAVDGPTVNAFVDLAKAPGRHCGRDTILLMC